jgi:deoxyribodipyrimidine photo-lyase
LINESGARGVVWNRRYEPDTIEREKGIKSELRGRGLEVESFNSLLLFEPWEISTKEGSPYRVYTPFSKTCFARGVTRKLFPAPELPPCSSFNSLEISDLGLMPETDWTGGINEVWVPGEPGAKIALSSFLEAAVQVYDEERNRPDRPATSRLSPHLHFGEISPLQIWYALDELNLPDDQAGILTYRKELLWREFAYHLLYYYPFTAFEPLRDEFKRFPWEMNRKLLKAWQRGQTGYPIVDAGMRELWHTGWMHNRVRMIVASFLVKDLLIPWQEGAKWFWDTLVDADLASNTMGWQWTAGCGADAAPFFRIFNPTSQGERFDPNGDYVRRWVPELARLPAKYIHSPWAAPPIELRDAQIELGKNYPAPIVDHSYARGRALEALDSLKRPKEQN